MTPPACPRPRSSPAACCRSPARPPATACPTTPPRSPPPACPGSPPPGRASAAPAPSPPGRPSPGSTAPSPSSCWPPTARSTPAPSRPGTPPPPGPASASPPPPPRPPPASPTSPASPPATPCPKPPAPPPAGTPSPSCPAPWPPGPASPPPPPPSSSNSKTPTTSSTRAPPAPPTPASAPSRSPASKPPPSTNTPRHSGNTARESGVIVNGQLAADRQRLAGEHEPGVEFGLLEREVPPHPDLAGDQPRPACPAHPALARERQVGPRPLRPVQHGRAHRDRHGRPSAIENDRGLAPAGHGRLGVLFGLGRSVLDVKELPVHSVTRDAQLGEHGHSVGHHAVRPAQPPVVDIRHVAERGQQPSQSRRIQPAAEQLDLLRLAGQYVCQLQPLRITVLQVGDLVGEHHRVGAPVPVQQRRVRPRVGQRRRRDRQHRRDARTRGDQHVPPRRAQIRGERPRRRLDLDPLPRPHLVHQPAGHRAAWHLADADAQGLAGRSADRVRAPLVPPAQQAPERQ